MAEQPTVLPRWADDPPAPPPTTIVEPSEPEKDEGFQPGVVAQQVDVTFAGDADGTYNVPINGVAHSHASSGQSLTQLIDSLAALINAGSEADVVTASNVGGTTLRILSDVAGLAFTYDALSSGGASAMTATLITANRSNKPIRQFLNWLFNLIYLWLAWLHQIAFRTDDIFGDQALPDGDPPGTGAGLGPIAADDFSARVYVNGYAVGPIGSPAHTYSASSDTYWDLGENGEWSFVVVAALDPEPAVTADSVRVFMVRTDATDRTAVTDFRRSRVTITKNVDVTGNLRLTTESVSTGAAGDSTFAELNTAHINDTLDDLSGATYQHLRSIETTSGLGEAHVYARMVGGGLSAGFVLVWGARLTGATTWTVDEADIFRFDFNPDDITDAIRFFRKTGLTPASTFADSAWDDQLAANTTRMQLPIAAGLKLGGGVFLQGGGAEANLISLLEFVRNPDAERTLIAYNSQGGEESYAEYLYFAGGALRHERAYNCLWNDDTDQWARTQSGHDAWVEDLGSTGKRLLLRASALASPWSDTIDPSGGWTLRSAFGTVVNKTYSVPASAFQNSYRGQGATLEFGIDATFPGLAAEMPRARTYGSASGNVLVAPISIPDGEIMTAARWRGFCDADARAWIQRKEYSTGTTTSMQTAPGYDSYTGIGGTASRDITMDATAAARTIDNTAYSYEVIIAIADATDTNTLNVAAVEIDTTTLRY